MMRIEALVLGTRNRKDSFPHQADDQYKRDEAWEGSLVKKGVPRIHGVTHD